MQLARDKQTSDPYLAGILRAQHINQMMHASLMPWEVGEISQDWLDAFSAMGRELPLMTEGFAKQAKIQEDWLRRMNYRQRRKTGRR